MGILGGCSPLSAPLQLHLGWRVGGGLSSSQAPQSQTQASVPSTLAAHTRSWPTILTKQPYRRCASIPRPLHLTDSQHTSGYTCSPHLFPGSFWVAISLGPRPVLPSPVSCLSALPLTLCRCAAMSST